MPNQYFESLCEVFQEKVLKLRKQKVCKHAKKQIRVKNMNFLFSTKNYEENPELHNSIQLIEAFTL